MDTLCWEVHYLSPPETTRYCKKCGAKTEHLSSGLFRVNAQQKSLDVWLIYRCVHCKTTWNLTIYSRVSPKSIGWELLQRFTANDNELAGRYAMDTVLLERNGAETATPPYSILGNDIDLKRDTRIKIISRYPANIRVSRIIREKMSLSRKAFEEMVSGGMIRLENGADIHKYKLQHETVVIVCGSSAIQSLCVQEENDQCPN